MRYEMDHIVLNVTDIEKMIDFYSNILLLKTERLEEFKRSEVPFPSVRLNEHTIIDLFPKNLWEPLIKNTSGNRNLNHFCMVLERANWESIVATIQDKGISIKVGPVNRWGALGEGISIYIEDPEDNLVEIRYYSELHSQIESKLSS